MKGSGPGYLHALLDRLAQHYAGQTFRDEAAHAKDEFIEKGGRVFDDDGELFESRMAAFLEWFLLERPGDKLGVTPVMHALTVKTYDAGDRRGLATLALSRRSLFDVGEVTLEQVELEDLLSGARHLVNERRGTAGFETGQIAEARLFFDGQSMVFGKTFLVHPAEARDVVLGRIDSGLQGGESPADLMFALSRLHLRWTRSRHLTADRAYAEA